MELIIDIFGVIIIIGILGVGILISFQEIHLNKEKHYKEIEKIDAEINLIKEKIINERNIAMAKLKQIYKINEQENKK